jgi:hypothetical protein
MKPVDTVALVLVSLCSRLRRRRTPDASRILLAWLLSVRSLTSSLTG